MAKRRRLHDYYPAPAVPLADRLQHQEDTISRLECQIREKDNELRQRLDTRADVEASRHTIETLRLTIALHERFLHILEKVVSRG